MSFYSKMISSLAALAIIGGGAAYVAEQRARPVPISSPAHSSSTKTAKRRVYEFDVP